MARLMAFDFGSKRLGIAVTDPMQIIATALDTIHPKDIISYLKKYLETESIEKFIVGEPFQTNGQHSETELQIQAFINLIRKNFPNTPIERQDERFTSKMAGQVIHQSGVGKKKRQSKELVDTISAVIILQSYMERRTFLNI